MVWKGVIIEESMENKELLNLVKIINTKRTTLEKESEKGTLQFHRIELEDEKKDEFVNKAKASLREGWYIHICKDRSMVVIFRNKMFEFTEKQQDTLDQARNYGLSIGIIKEQMPFERLLIDPYS